MAKVACSRLAFVAGMALIAAGGNMTAGTIGPSCSNCFGGIYTAEAIKIASFSTAVDTWDSFLHTRSYQSDYQERLGLRNRRKELSPLEWPSETFSLPTVGSWSGPQPGRNNSDGYQVGGNANRFPFIMEAHGGTNMTGASHVWEYDVDVTKGRSLGVGSIKAKFIDQAKRNEKGVLLSQSTTVRADEGPAAAELSLLLLALGGFVAYRRSELAG